MRFRVLALILLGATLILTPCYGQVVVGQVPSRPDLGGTAVPSLGPRTLIDLNHPADGSGTLTAATVVWDTSVPCANAFKIRFFRGSGGTSLQMIAERGPFSTTRDTFISVSLSPPVTVQKDDLIGVAEIGGVACGGLESGVFNSPTETALSINGDFTGGLPPSDSDRNRVRQYGVRASSNALALVGIVPVVGTVPGAFGARFRTTLQVTNPGNFTLSSPTFTFHPAGDATPSDPSTAIRLTAGATTAVDILDTLGISSGLGSLDVYTKGEYAPVVVARVYNDTGSGTNGFNEAMIPRSAALHGDLSVLTFPSDLTNFRMNIGVRTLDAPVTITLNVLESTGHIVAQFDKSYPPNYFSQTSLSVFIAPAVPTANGSVGLFVDGAAIVYSTTTDNLTNDSAISIAQPTP